MARPQHLGDSDRLADRPSEPEQDRRDHAASRVGQDDTADHLPARRAQRECALLELFGHADEELAADARRDRNDHDRQHEDRDENTRVLRGAAEERNEAEMAVYPGLKILSDERPEDEDAPEAEDDARNRCQELD